ncbi:MAG: ATP-binding protein [Desulfobacteraceae bacterium]|nr:ATP-binding protein [Desulfobacteraceae bacterium]
MGNNKAFTFEISLSVLNHLGRNLYRSFTTVLGEAISNSWDANAENVWIYIDKENNSFFIKDDGDGMTADDFQDKFLKIGYSKRKEGETSPVKGRPYIGRKGIGKLALLSCANKISVISKVLGDDYIGGVIDNSGLDKAIIDDLTPKEYALGDLDNRVFTNHMKGHTKGTIIHFEETKEGIRHSLNFLKKIVALYFRFSLIDPNFNIFIEDEKVTQDCLNDLVSKTQFLWKINTIADPYIEMLQNKFTADKNEQRQLDIDSTIKGFVASVEKPSHLKIRTMEEKVSIDLFVNGRLRERDILKHIPTTRVVESYLYGQIHFDDLNDTTDRFTSSREGVVVDDPKYNDFLTLLKTKVINKIMKEWDEFRVNHKEEGDSENMRLTPKKRKSLALFDTISKDYEIPKSSKYKDKVDDWVDNLRDDASFNFTSYAECFISENLTRAYIQDKKLSLAKKEGRIERFKKEEKESKAKGNINIELRESASDLSYLDMGDLAHIVEKASTENCLPKDAKQYKPIRDALMHTARLTKSAKLKLTSVYDNIQGRIKELLSEK